MEEKLNRLAIIYKDVLESKKKDNVKYQELLALVSDILDYMDEFVTSYNRILFISIAKDILGRTLVVRDKVTCEVLSSRLENVTYEITNLDEVVSSFLLPRISTKTCMSNTFYTSAKELFDDFRLYVSHIKNVPASIRPRVYSYMFYIADIVLKEIEKQGIVPNDYDEYLLVWLFKQVVKSDEFIQAKDKKNIYGELLKKRTEARYLVLKNIS